MCTTDGECNTSSADIQALFSFIVFADGRIDPNRSKSPVYYFEDTVVSMKIIKDNIFSHLQIFVWDGV